MSVKGQLSYGFDVGFAEEQFGFYDDPAAPEWVHQDDPIGAAEQLPLPVSRRVLRPLGRR